MYSRRKAELILGVDADLAHTTAWNAKGPSRVSHTPVVLIALDKRVVLPAERLAGKPTARIPGACSGWAETQAAYQSLTQRELEWSGILDVSPTLTTTFDDSRVGWFEACS